MGRVAFDVSEVVALADHLAEAAEAAPERLAGVFDGWVGEVADVMRDEVPKDTWELHDSITVEKDGPLSATIGPTNTDEQGRPVGFFVNYGAGNRAPNDFIGRTAAVAGEAAGAFSDELGDVL